MNTCVAEPFFQQIFPESYLDLVPQHFDLVAPINDFQPSQVAGVITTPTWELDAGINIIIGPSGSGKTRILEAMKRPLKGLAPATFNFKDRPTNLSFGQMASLAFEALLQVQPQKSCLMIDDAMGMLDQFHLEHWYTSLRQHDKQVLLAMGISTWERSAPMIKNLTVKQFHLELMPRR